MLVFLATHQLLTVFAICLGLIFIAGVILGFIHGLKTKKRVADFADSLVNPPAEDPKDTAASAKEGEGDTEEDEEFPDPVFEEYAVTVKQMQCGVGLDKQHRYSFLVTFETSEGKELVFNVGQTLYLSLTEGQTGFLATVNGNFFGFTTENEAAEGEDAEEGAILETEEAPLPKETDAMAE